MANLIERDRQFVWHPFTQHKTECAPIPVEGASGAILSIEGGGEILDLISSWWTITHGHSHPELVKTVAVQAARLCHVMFSGFTHEPAVALAEALGHHLGDPLTRVFYSDNGSTSVEVALKVAFQYWRNRGDLQRTNFIAFEGAYHGDTFGAMAVGKGSGFFSGFEELLTDVITVPYANSYIGDEDIEAREQAALAALSRVFDQQGESIAGLIIEPLFQGAGGMRFCRPTFIDQVVTLSRKAGVLVIFDEIAAGFGRTGQLFAHQHCSVKPDIICLSKGLTAGMMPLSVTVVDEALYQAFLGDDFTTALAHGHSFTANPLAAALAVRSLELFEEERTLDKIARIERHHRQFAPVLARHPLATKVRVCGSLLAFDLFGRDGGYKSEASLKLRDHFLSAGFNIRPLGDTVYLMPPYCIEDRQLSRAYDGLLLGLNTL